MVKFSLGTIHTVVYNGISTWVLVKVRISFILLTLDPFVTFRVTPPF